MERWKITTMTTALVFLLFAIMFPALWINNARASSDEHSISKVLLKKNYRGQWWKIETDLITILFPAAGKKSMFLWWYSNDTSNIYVVKYKGLIEYLTIDYPYYIHKYEANNLTMQKRLEEKYAIASPNKTQIQDKIQNYISAWYLGFHPAYLPFSACQWELSEPSNVTRDSVSYISFNFTLAKAPVKFRFAENNVIIRCRFYTTDATEEIYGLYNYTVHAGEFKMDFVVKNWKWNIDKLDSLFTNLQNEFKITKPKMRAGLALWVDLASIEIVDLPIAEQDANLPIQALPTTNYSAYSASVEPVETRSTTSDIIVEGQRVHVQENKTAGNADETPIPIKHRIYERCRLRFARGSQTLAGFFDFVNTAVVINSTTDETSLVNVTAAYISAGNHMRLFIGYPYFGNNTLEHDPSIGVESVTPWLPTSLLMMLIGATIIVAVVVAAVKIRKKTVNIVGFQDSL